MTTRSDVALYVWDYFYVRHVPAAGDEVVWAVIERATCRILESEPSLRPPMPPDVRLRSARRVRSAARLARRKIELLSSEPERWVVDGLVELETHADDIIRTLSEVAKHVVVH
jgi:hypothetical protein